jgi:hypothetical protein
MSMSAKVMLGVMLAGTALVIFLGARREPPPPAPPPPVHDAVPWLSKEAAAQIVNVGGAPGPLFADVHLGLPLPAEAQARIAHFAKANNVEIALDVRDGVLAAIRFAVSYGGCCGYEGADVLADRMGRPATGNCCVCGPNTWIDDWTTVDDSGIHMRGRVRINRVLVRWEKTATFAEIIEQADSLLGAKREDVARRAGDQWYEIEPNRRYLLEVPFPVAASNDYGSPPPFEQRRDVGMSLTTYAGVITEVSVPLREPYGDGETPSELQVALTARWGRPRIREGTWTWRTTDRKVTAQLEQWPGPMLTITR